jgi:hypothetical protein
MLLNTWGGGGIGELNIIALIEMLMGMMTVILPGIMPVPMLMVMMTVSKNDAAGNSFAAFAVGNNDADKTAPTADGNNSHFLMPVRIPLLLEMLRGMPLGMLIMLL